MQQVDRRSNQSEASSIRAQDLLAQTELVARYGFLKKKDKRLVGTPWIRKFVILTSDTLFVFDDESSQSPQERIELKGYKSASHYISKSKSQQALWPFCLDPVYSLFPLEKFACASERDRAQWIQSIENSICSCCPLLRGPKEKGVDLVRARPHTYGKLVGTEARLASQEDSVSRPKLQENSAEQSPLSPDLSTMGDAEVKSSSADHGKGLSLPRKLGQKVLNLKTKSSTLGHSSSKFHVPLVENDDEGDHYDQIDESAMARAVVKREAQKQTTMGNSNVPSRAAPVPPPRRPRAHCVQDDTEPYYEDMDTPPISHDQGDSKMSNYEDVHIYSRPNDIVSLERMASVLESRKTREELNAELKTKAPGTYFIRFSRQGGLRVLTFHCGDGIIKEYRIFHTQAGRLTIHRGTQEPSFISTDEFLRAFTVQMPLPDTDGLYLKQGFFYNAREQMPEELEVENDECEG